jgi:hypothetical protein
MKTISLALLCLLFAGCAASNGGGHVVGNPLQPMEIGLDEANPCDCQKVNQASECGCGNPKKNAKPRR